MSWTGIASDLTLTDVIGAPLDNPAVHQAPSALGAQLRAAFTAPSRPAQAASPAAGAAHPRAATFTKPPPDVFATEDMLQPQPSRARRLGVLLMTGAILIAAAAAWKGKPDAPATTATPVVGAGEQAPAPEAPTKPSAHTKAKPPAKPEQQKAKPVKAAPPPAAQPTTDEAGDFGDMSLEKFRQLSGNT
jgi:hypothetical protein